MIFFLSCSEGALVMTGGTKRKIAVSTIAEARFYADNGFDDILYAFPFSADKKERYPSFHQCHLTASTAPW